jgi:hypothetical protein
MALAIGPEMARAARRKSLWPREHGAYVQLLAPLVAALAVARPTLGSGLFAVAACLAFVGSEALRVATGARGLRARTEQGDRALRLLAILALCASVAGIAACAIAPRAVPFAIAAAVPAAITCVLATRRRAGIASELAAAITLSGAGVPVMAASGVDALAIAELWLAWSIAFGGSTFAVHRVMDRSRSGARDTAVIGALVGTALGIAIGAKLAPAIAIATPILLASAAIVAAGRPKLRTVGFVLAAVTVSSVALAIATI